MAEMLVRATVNGTQKAADFIRWLSNATEMELPDIQNILDTRAKTAKEDPMEMSVILSHIGQNVKLSHPELVQRLHSEDELTPELIDERLVAIENCLMEYSIKINQFRTGKGNLEELVERLETIRPYVCYFTE